MTTFLLTTLCAFALQAGIVSAPADTLNRYIIDSKVVDDFDGSQLVGVKVESYSVEIVSIDGKVFRVHDITTDRKPAPNPLVIVDGKVASMDDLEKIDPASISRIEVYKAKSAEDKYTEYGDTSGGVIVIELRAQGSYTPSEKTLGKRMTRINSIRIKKE
ncbi:MAG: hypothetical protein LIQ26_00570 [Bacteroidota bacterium]|nr:hypothetical protein [Bacteroidota bacterium]